MAETTHQVISEYRMKKYESFFKFFDVNNDGLITAEDAELMITNFAQLSNASPLEVEGMRNMVTHWWRVFSNWMESNDKVTIPEAVERLAKYVRTNPTISLQENHKTHKDLFDLIDGNKDGRISITELETFYKAYGVNDTTFVLKVFKGIDSNGDGVITRDEFVAAHEAFWFSDDPENGFDFVYPQK